MRIFKEKKLQDLRDVKKLKCRPGKKKTTKVLMHTSMTKMKNTFHKNNQMPVLIKHIFK